MWQIGGGKVCDRRTAVTLVKSSRRRRKRLLECMCPMAMHTKQFMLFSMYLLEHSDDVYMCVRYVHGLRYGIVCIVWWEGASTEEELNVV